MWTRNREQEQERVLVLVLAQWLRPGGRAGWSLTCKTQLWSRLWVGAPSRLGKSSCDPIRGSAAVEFQTGSLTSPLGTTGVNVPIRTSPRIIEPQQTRHGCRWQRVLPARSLTNKHPTRITEAWDGAEALWAELKPLNSTIGRRGFWVATRPEPVWRPPIRAGKPGTA